MMHPFNGITVGLVVGSEVIWRWQYQLIQSLEAQGMIAVGEVVMLNQPNQPRVSRAASMVRSIDAALYRSPLNGLERVDVSRLSNSLQSETAFLNDPSKTVQAWINLSEMSVSSALISKAKWGLLESRFSMSGQRSSQLLGWQEYLSNEKQVLLSVVQCLEQGATQVIAEMRASVDQGSLNRNITGYYRWMIPLWARALNALKSNPGWIAGDAGQNNHLPEKNAFDSTQPMDQSSSLGELALGLTRLAGHMKYKLGQKFLYQEQWVLLVKPRSETNHMLEEDLGFEVFKELSPPDDCFWADPFVVSHADRDYVFFEELPFATERGHLSCMELFTDGTHDDPVTIIQEPHHLSYPNVFEYEGQFYLVPESGDIGRVDLYCCDEFPYQWRFHSTLIDNLHAYDSTFIEHAGRWWLFATVAPELGLSGCEALHLFSADSPISQNWQAHPMNPIISDASIARPAGRFFREGSHWYRVSQDCAGRYGAGININKIEDLSLHAYRESKVETHYPDWDDQLTAMHTLNVNEQFAVVDALRVKRKGLRS